MLKKNSPGCNAGSCGCAACAIGSFTYTGGVVADYFNVITGSYAISSGLVVSSTNAVAVSLSPTTDPDFGIRLKGHVTIASGDAARIYLLYTDASNYAYVEIKVGPSAHLRFVTVLSGSIYSTQEYFGYEEDAGTLAFCVSFNPVADVEIFHITVNDKSFYAYPDKSPTADWGLGSGTLSGSVVFTDVQVQLVNATCPECHLPTCPTFCEQLWDGVFHQYISAYFNSTLGSDDACDNCESVGGERIRLVRGGAYALPFGCEFSTVPGAPVNENACYYFYCKYLCQPDGCFFPDGDPNPVFEFVRVIITPFVSETNGQCFVACAAEIYVAGCAYLSGFIYEPADIPLETFKARVLAGGPLFTLSGGCNLVNTVFSSPICVGNFPIMFADTLTIYANPIEGDVGSECGGIGSFLIFQQCCHDEVTEDPVTHLIWPAASFTVFHSFTPVSGKVYLLDVDIGGGQTTQVCATFWGESDEVRGPWAGLSAGPYDTCAECLGSCEDCNAQYLQYISVKLPIVACDTSGDPPHTCPKVCAGYNARWAGQEIDFPFFLGTCPSSQTQTRSFSYESDPETFCGDGPGTVTVTLNYANLGGGLFKWNVFVEVDGSVSAGAEVIYEETGISLPIICVPGHTYSLPKTSSLAGDGSDPIFLTTQGISCGEMMAMAEPQSEEEAMALPAGSRFRAPDGSIRTMVV